MKISRIVASVLLALFVIPAFAMLPPSYLSVKKWKRCVSSYKEKKATFWCLPDKQPKECPNRSWKQLTEMSNLPSCPEKDGAGSAAPGSAAPGMGSTPSGMGSTPPAETSAPASSNTPQ